MKRRFQGDGPQPELFGQRALIARPPVEERLLASFPPAEPAPVTTSEQLVALERDLRNETRRLQSPIAQGRRASPASFRAQPMEA